MSQEIIILGIGVILIFVALLGLSNPKVKVPVAILGVLGVIYGGFSYGNINMVANIEQVATANELTIDSPITKVQITSPVQDDVVKCRVLTKGVYPKDHSKDIWVLLKPTDDKYYPQSDHTNTSYKMNGEWQVITRFGGDKDEMYEVIVYETDTEASAFFSSTIAKWNEAMEFTGLKADELPKGAVEIDRIKVTLQDNCRGVH